MTMMTIAYSPAFATALTSYRVTHNFDLIGADFI